MPVNQQAKSGVPAVAGVIYPDDQGEVDWLLYNQSKQEYAWNTVEPWVPFQQPLQSVTEVEQKL